jgi:gamma-glutamyl-gamma-aminobutyrate hydrolase PuuD
MPDHPYGIAVQWHPEWLTAHNSMRALFADFSEAANNHKRIGGS